MAARLIPSGLSNFTLIINKNINAMNISCAQTSWGLWLVHVQGDGYGFASLSWGISPKLICGYSCIVQKVQTAHKREQIPIAIDRSLYLNGYCSHFWDRSPSPGKGPVPVSVNEPLQEAMQTYPCRNNHYLA